MFIASKLFEKRPLSVELVETDLGEDKYSQFVILLMEIKILRVLKFKIFR